MKITGNGHIKKIEDFWLGICLAYSYILEEALVFPVHFFSHDRAQNGKVLLRILIRKVILRLRKWQARINVDAQAISHAKSIP
jgi:hypothetical protein